MQLTTQHTVFFLGAGSMSEAMIKGLLTAKLLVPQQIIVSNRSKEARLQTLQQRYGVRTSQPGAQRNSDISQADIIVLAMKPYDLAQALQEVAPFMKPEQLIISVAAGISTSSIEKHSGQAMPIIRSMPNTSSFVLASATAMCAGRWADATHVALAQHLFSAIGISVMVDEEQMDAVTGLSGTGPAYFYYVVEALLEAGQACGLSPAVCHTLVLQTLLGSAKMLQETGQNPAELRRQVTSPNGTTMAGISVLEQGQVQQLFSQAVQRATQRAAELGAEGQQVPSTGALSVRTQHQ